jgi:hypothetical protein
MSAGIILILVIATFFNYLIVRKNLANKRYGNIFIDMSMILALTWLFGGTITGMAIATSVSAMISVHLIFKPVLFNKKQRN